ncbi:MAG TPA: hypothetical protein VF426_02865 [Marmoricola sp.]
MRYLASVAVAATIMLALPTAGAVAGAGTTDHRAAVRADGAGSLVFIRNGDVWISRPDGTGARALTRDGTGKDAYRTPTQDDHGHIYALRGHGANAAVSRLDQQGRLLKRYRVPIASLGPDFVSVSPDGKKLAYETMFAASDCSFTPCHTFFQHAVEYADAETGKALRGAHEVQDADFASWAGNGRTVLQTRSLNVVALHRPAEKRAIEWFASCLSYQEGCGETDTFNFSPSVNRQGTRFATSRLDDKNGAQQAYLLVYATKGATTGNPPALPGAGCGHPAAAPTADLPGRTDLTISAPSFSPAGRSVVFAQRMGKAWNTRVYTPVIGDCAASDPVTVVRNAGEPHWSAAPLARPKLIWTRAAHPKLTGKAKPGRMLRPAMSVKAIRNGFRPTASKVRFQWLRNGHAIKHATKAKYRIRKADRYKRIKVRVTATRKGLIKAVVTTRAVRVR